MAPIKPLNTYVDITYGFLFFVHEHENQAVLSQWQIHNQSHEFWLSGADMHPNEQVVEVFFESNINLSTGTLTFTLPQRVINLEHATKAFASSDKILVMTQINNFYYSLWLMDKLDNSKKERLVYFSSPEDWHVDALYRHIRVFNTISSADKEDIANYAASNNSAGIVLQLKW